jgi:NAD(P)-dependent dehydrogenase (short-subunit alcohol dehydrogenase family)
MANRETGLEAAKQLSHRGNRVIMVARNEERLRREAGRLHATQVSGLLSFVVQQHPDLDGAARRLPVLGRRRIGLEDRPCSERRHRRPTPEEHTR